MNWTVINNTVEAAISINRIRSFLLSDEHRPVLNLEKDSDDAVVVRLHGVSAAYESSKPKPDPSILGAKEIVDKEWEIELVRAQLEEAERKIGDLAGRPVSSGAGDEAGPYRSLLCLKRVDFECNAGEVVAVVGGVGSGKTSFVNAILGEVRRLAGTASVNGTVAYFSQVPFIMNASLRDNVLFGHVDDSSIDEERYQRALDCCALRHDLELLPDGDSTEIGEKGVRTTIYYCSEILH